MNVHFLELFYYVAKHGGISAAVSQIPYGIQQPAVSTQVGKLERELGVKLFTRTPFRLTPAGEILFAHVSPFFEQLKNVESRVRATRDAELRIAGAELILRDHLPTILSGVRKQFPGLRYTLRTPGFQPEAENWLRRGEIDLVFQILERRAPAKLNQRPMARLPLVLQVPMEFPQRTAAELWSEKRLSHPLICLAEATTLARTFQRDLKKRGIHWPQTIEAPSLDLVRRYVENGDGIGVNVDVAPGKKLRGIRVVALPGFAPITVGAVWSGELAAAAKATVEDVHAYARKSWPQAAL